MNLGVGSWWSRKSFFPNSKIGEVIVMKLTGCKGHLNCLLQGPQNEMITTHEAGISWNCVKTSTRLPSLSTFMDLKISPE